MKRQLTVMCSNCKRVGTAIEPLVVIGDDENRVSSCCKSKVLLVDMIGPFTT